MANSNQWLRLWHDMPNDPKWRTIARASGQPIALVQAVYLHLLVDASRNVTRGHVTVTAEDMASALDVTEDQIEAVISAMQGRVLDGQRVSGWEVRQPKKEDQGNEETGARSAAQRKRDQRERERERMAKGESHGESRNVTPDKEKDKSKEQELSPSIPQGDQQVKPSPAKPKFDARQACPPNVTPEVWNRWVQCRKEQGKPLKETTCESQVRQLINHPRAADVLEYSIANGYQGLFPEKFYGKGQQIGGSCDSSAVGKVKQAIAAREAAEARTAALGQALDQDGRDLRDALDGEFRHVG